MAELKIEIPGVPPSAGHYNAYRCVHRPDVPLYHPVDAAEPIRIGQGQRRYDR